MFIPVVSKVPPLITTPVTTIFGLTPSLKVSVTLWLSSASVEVRGKTATLVLLGTCPTRSRTSDGEHDVREWFPDDTEEGEGEAGAPHGDPTFVPIPAGHTLTFRPAEKNPGPAAEVVAPPHNNPARERYTVKPGDNLTRIAERFYGDADQWDIIYNHNRDAIGPDPGRLKAGMTLDIPPAVAGAN